MAAPTSPFLDKLSSELRLRIYGYVFGTSQVLKPGSSNTALGMRKDPTAHIAHCFAPPAPDTSLDISILLSNKAIFNEALPVLYGENVIRGTTDDFDKLLQHADFAENGSASRDRRLYQLLSKRPIPLGSSPPPDIAGNSLPCHPQRLLGTRG